MPTQEVFQVELDVHVTVEGAFVQFNEHVDIAIGTLLAAGDRAEYAEAFRPERAELFAVLADREKGLRNSYIASVGLPTRGA